MGNGKAGRKGRAKGGDEPLRNGEVNTVGEEEENGRGVAGAGGGGSREKLGASEMSVVFHELKGLVNKVSEGEKPLAVSFRFLSLYLGVQLDSFCAPSPRPLRPLINI